MPKLPDVFAAGKKAPAPEVKEEKAEKKEHEGCPFYSKGKCGFLDRKISDLQNDGTEEGYDDTDEEDFE